VSGGPSGWKFTAIPDPIVDAAGSGFNLRSRVYPLPGDAACIDLRALQAHTTFQNTALFMVPWEIKKAVSLVPPPGSGTDEKEDGESKPDVHNPSAGHSVVFVPARIDLPEQYLWSINRPVQVKWKVPMVPEAHTVKSDGAMANVMVIMVKPLQGWTE
jgi:hypothetical protein